MHFHRGRAGHRRHLLRHVIKPRPDELFTGTPRSASPTALRSCRCSRSARRRPRCSIERATPAEPADAIAAHGATVRSTAPTAPTRASPPAGGRRRHVRRSAALRLGRRAPAEVGLAGVPPGHRHRDHRRHLVRPRCCTSSSQPPTPPSGPARRGHALPGYRATILDSDGHEGPDGQPGWLAVQGLVPPPRPVRRAPAKLRAATAWNITGDTYIADASNIGYFWFQARSDDMIIAARRQRRPARGRGGTARRPRTPEVAVVGAPDPVLCMIVQAFVVLREGVTPDAAKVAELQQVRQAVDRAVQVPTNGWSSSSQNC